MYSFLLPSLIRKQVLEAKHSLRNHTRLYFDLQHTHPKLKQDSAPDCKYLNLVVYNLELYPIIKYRFVQSGIPPHVTEK